MQVASAAMVVPHPEKVSPTSKASLRPHFGYGGEDAYYCGWGPRCAPILACFMLVTLLRFVFGGEDGCYCGWWTLVRSCTSWTSLGLTNASDVGTYGLTYEPGHTHASRLPLA